METPTLYEVGIVTEFEASHSLEGDFGPAREMHTHRYRVEVVVKGPQLRGDGTLIDIAVLSSAAQKATGELEGRTLNDLQEFAAQNSTAESVSKFFFDKIAPELLEASIESLKVRVWESDQAFAAYESRLNHP